MTSRDLSVTFSVFKKLWRKWTLAQNLLGLEWCNLAKSVTAGGGCWRVVILVFIARVLSVERACSAHTSSIYICVRGSHILINGQHYLV